MKRIRKINLQFFGGRGASSGMSERGKLYYEPLLETMTAGRIYVQVGGQDVVRVIFMNESNKKCKVIEKDKKRKTWHVHHGYFHAEESEQKHEPLSPQDQILIEKINKLWHNRSR